MAEAVAIGKHPRVASETRPVTKDVATVGWLTGAVNIDQRGTAVFTNAVNKLHTVIVVDTVGRVESERP